MGKHMKIAVLSSHTHSLFWFRIDMMKAFTSKGYEVVAVGNENEEKWQQQFASQGIKYRQLQVERNGMNPFRDLKTLNQIREILKEEQPDKVFTYQAKTIIYGGIAAKMEGIKEVYPMVAGLGSIFRGESLKSRILKLIMVTEYKFALKNSSKIIFQNGDDLNSFVKAGIVPREKCEIVNGSGVDIEKFQMTEMPETPGFLMIARLIKDKGICEYLETCKRIKEKYPQCRCLLVGPYDTNPSALKESELEPYIEQGIIEYFGEQSDVRPYIAQSSVFVLPSYHEGTPKTVLEAMSMGRAIITTDAPGCRETVIEGENGYLVPVKDVEATVEKMEYLINHPQKISEMGSKGRRIVEEKYDVNKVNKSIMQIMNI